MAAASPGSPAPARPAAHASLIRAERLFPTSRTHPDPRQVAEARLPANIVGDTPARITADCQCAPGTPEADQFANLVIEVQAPGGKVYVGPLDTLDATVDKLAHDVKLRVWLADTGAPQAQGVATSWTIRVDPAAP